MISISKLVTSSDVNSKEFLLFLEYFDNNDIPFDNQQVNVIRDFIIKTINSFMNRAKCNYLVMDILDRILPKCFNDVPPSVFPFYVLSTELISNVSKLAETAQNLLNFSISAINLCNLCKVSATKLLAYQQPIISGGSLVWLSEILSVHALSWISQTTEILRNMHSTQDLTIACKVLGSLIILCKKIPELQKHISMHNVKLLINVLSTLKTDKKCGAVYYLIAVLLFYYPEVCEQCQRTIRKMIFLQIDSTQENLVNASANCYVLLSKATERSFKSSSIHTGWTYNEALLCKSLHIIMDELFTEKSENIDIQDKLELPPISDSNVVLYYYGQQRRFSNLCVYLASMLRGYEEKNSVLPHYILEVICRGLALTPLNIKSEVSVKEQMLYIILPKLHISLLTVLDAFINGFTQELIPFGETILQLFQQTLQWTNTVLVEQTTFNGGKSFRNVRTCAYKCLTSWLMHTGSLSGIETIINEYITVILKDIIPEKDCISLLAPFPIRNTIRSLKNRQNILSPREVSPKHSLDVDLCREALITLQNILFSGNILLKEIFYKNVQDTIINLLYNFYLGIPQSFYKAHHDCRLQLFKVLKALQMNPHITLVFPIQYYLEISQMAARDIDLRIVQEAKLASTELEKIVHPIGPTLQLPQQEKPNNKSVFESQVEEIATISTADKRKIEEDSAQNTDAMSSECKRPKILELRNDILKQHNLNFQSIIDILSPEVNENLCEDIKKKNIEDIDIEYILRRQDKQYLREKRQQKNCQQYIHCQHIDEISKATENRMECELTIYDNIEQQKQNIEQERKEQDTEQQEQDTEQKQQEQDTEQKQQEQDTEQEQQEQPKNLLLCTDEPNKKIEEKIPPHVREIQWEILKNHPIELEQLNTDTLESINLFHSEV